MKASEILRAMAKEQLGCSTAATARAGMHVRAAATHTHEPKARDAKAAARRASEDAAFYAARAQALEDGARLLENAERSAA